MEVTQDITLHELVRTVLPAKQGLNDLHTCTPNNKVCLLIFYQRTCRQGCTVLCTIKASVKYWHKDWKYVTSSKALVSNSFLLLVVRHLLLVAMPLFLGISNFWATNDFDWKKWDVRLAEQHPLLAVATRLQCCRSTSARRSEACQNELCK